MQNAALTQATSAGASPPPGTGFCSDHVEPFQCAASVLLVAPLGFGVVWIVHVPLPVRRSTKVVVPEVPTAKQFAVPGHDTENKNDSDEPTGFGVFSTDQFTPSQCSANGTKFVVE